MTYLPGKPTIPRATDSDVSDDPVVGFPALTDTLADNIDSIADELVDARGSEVRLRVQ